MELKFLDLNVSLMDQLSRNDESERNEPVIFLAVHQVIAEDSEDFVSTWMAEGAFLTKQPGFISRELSRGCAGSSLFIDYMKFSSLNLFKASFLHPDHQPLIESFSSIRGESRVNIFKALSE